MNCARRPCQRCEMLEALSVRVRRRFASDLSIELDEMCPDEDVSRIHAWMDQNLPVITGEKPEYKSPGIEIEVNENNGLPSVDFVFRHPECHEISGIVFVEEGRDPHRLASALRGFVEDMGTRLDELLGEHYINGGASDWEVSL